MDEVIHDIKNALTAIRTCAEILGHDELNADERKEFAQTLTREIDRVIGITQDLLEFPYGHQETLNIQTCALKEVIEEILPIIKYSFVSQNITMQTDLQYTGEVQIDISKMKRVFRNIADNARDAMSNGGLFTINSRLENNYDPP